MEEEGEGWEEKEKGSCGGLITYTHTHTHTHTQDVPDYEVQWRIEKQKPGHCAALIYTSGTTGPPKV